MTSVLIMISNNNIMRHQFLQKPRSIIIIWYAQGSMGKDCSKSVQITSIWPPLSICVGIPCSAEIWSLSSFFRISEWGSFTFFTERSDSFSTLAAVVASAYLAVRLLLRHFSSAAPTSFWAHTRIFGSFFSFTFPSTYCSSAFTNWKGLTCKRPSSLPCFTDRKCASTWAFERHRGSSPTSSPSSW